jgi:hypothetical protein
MGDLHISLSYRYVIRIDQFHVTAAIMVQRSIGVEKRKQDVTAFISYQNIDNSECFGVKFVKIYPEMTSQ